MSMMRKHLLLEGKGDKLNLWTNGLNLLIFTSQKQFCIFVIA